MKITYARIKHTFLEFKKAFREVSRGKHLIAIDYPVNPKPRFGYEKPPNPQLYKIIGSNRKRYADHLSDIINYKKYFLNITEKQNDSIYEPKWINGYLPALDSIAIYYFISKFKPKKYVEIGSGNSTKFALRAKKDHSPTTNIISVDPQPRDEIDRLCNQIIREPLENCDLSIFDALQEGDIVFFDGSHRSFMNSDVTVFFIEILPRLKHGVIVHIHDITLPNDYFPGSEEHYFNEQYLLACYLLAKGSLFETIFPCRFISDDPELSSILKPLWDDPKMQGLETHGCSFWLKIKDVS